MITGLVKFFVVVGLLLLGASSVTVRAAAPREYPEHNLAITPPDGWEEVPLNSKEVVMGAAFRDSKSGRMVMAIVNSNEGDVQELDEKAIRDFEAGIENGGGGKRKFGRTIQVHNVPAYERAGEVTTGGRKMTTYTRFIPVVGAVYSIQGIATDGREASEDPEIRSFVESLRFLRPPSLPEPKSAGYRLGYFLGRYFFPSILIVAVIGAIVAGTIFGLRRRN